MDSVNSGDFAGANTKYNTNVKGLIDAVDSGSTAIKTLFTGALGGARFIEEYLNSVETAN